MDATNATTCTMMNTNIPTYAVINATSNDQTNTTNDTIYTIRIVNATNDLTNSSLTSTTTNSTTNNAVSTTDEGS